MLRSVKIVLKLSQDIRFKDLGGTQIRTGGKGFAVLCLTTWPCRPISSSVKPSYGSTVYSLSHTGLKERCSNIE
jgi:hypothetical protein